jgi:hypothetical protein
MTAHTTRIGAAAWVGAVTQIEVAAQVGVAIQIVGVAVPTL